MAELLLIVLVVLSVLAGWWIVQAGKASSAWDIVAKIGVAYAVFTVLSWLVSLA